VVAVVVDRLPTNWQYASGGFIVAFFVAAYVVWGLHRVLGRLPLD
jgi:hypothetical protein